MPSNPITDYPAYTAPYCGDHNELSEQQAAENFTYFQQQKEKRLNHLAALLSHYSIDLHENLYTGDYRPLVKSLYEWFGKLWPTTIKPEFATRDVWRVTDRQREQILYSVAMDLGIALGEIIISRRPSYSWGLDLDPKNISDQMPTARRVVILAPSQIANDRLIVIDCEAICASLIFNQSPTYGIMNLWLNMVNDAVSGLTEGSWAAENQGHD
jgi:hypothetical protein